jgi:hypothetical protein
LEPIHEFGEELLDFTKKYGKSQKKIFLQVPSYAEVTIFPARELYKGKKNMNLCTGIPKAAEFYADFKNINLSL